MGKKKKLKSSLFYTDYSNISLEDQYKMSLLAKKLMSGEDIDCEELFNKDKDMENEPVSDISGTDNSDDIQSFLRHVIPEHVTQSIPVKRSINMPNNDIQDQMTELRDLSDQLIDDCVVKHKPVNENNEIDSNDQNINNEKNDNIKEIADHVKKYTSESYMNEDDNDDEYDEDDDSDLENIFGTESDEDEEPTLDNQFKTIVSDYETGDIVINDSWKSFKSHTISFFNMIESSLNYDNSPLYEKMKGFVDLAISFIAGPILIIKQGNSKFKNFINNVKSFDRERIFVLSKISESDKDEDGKPAIHFLVYYIDQESKDSLETLFDVFEEPDDDHNKIIIDFLLSIYKKTIDRHENPWGDYYGIDTLIDEYESSDEDVDFVLDLIMKDKDTVIGESDIDHFFSNFTLPIEEFITSSYKETGGLFNLFTTLLEHVLNKESNNIVYENGIIKIPDNFGIISTEESKPVIERDTIEESIDNDFDTSNDVDLFSHDSLDIDDVDDDFDFDLSDSNDDKFTKTATNNSAEPKKLGTPDNTGIKKFGSVPYNGGSMIVK